MPSSVDELTLAQVMLPEDANPRGNVHGGTLMKLADTAGGVCATRHARRPVVTVVIDSMTFEQPVYVGNLVVLHATVKDRRGAYVSGLPKEAFSVLEGAQPQTISLFTSDDAPSRHVLSAASGRAAW